MTHSAQRMTVYKRWYVIKSFRDLDIWNKGMQIAREVYQFTSKLPVEEKYGLASQMRRAAVSLPSNIAEGFRRRNSKEFKQFLHIALGSAAELETQLELCRELFNTESEKTENLFEWLDHFQAMTMSLIKELNA